MVKKADQYFELTILSVKLNNGRSWATCLCSCGVKTVKRLDCIKSGGTKSCGHLLATTNNQSATSMYRIYASMKQRCVDPNATYFYRYGGRGIKVCKRWLDSFNNFQQDMGERPEGMTLERIDNDGDYEPSNCRWATRKEQANNRKSNVFYDINGERLTLGMIGEKYNINVKRVRNAMYRGFTINEALRKEGLA